MIIESVAAASAILTSLNGLIQQANETGQGMQQLMGTISDFGEALTNFEVERRGRTFKALTQSEILKLTMIKKSYERHWKDVHDLLLVADPQMLEAFKQAKAEQEQQRQKHMKMLAKKRKEREILIQQLLVGFTTFLIGGALIAGVLFVLFN